MIKLRKMLLIHWFTYAKQVIEFDNTNFLTGPTASGKSTIIDAMQIVLLGEARGKFFNKAANENSQRTLKGYLYGEMGDNEEAGFHYLRNGKKFSSYIVLEFEDTERKRNFCTGIIFDCPAEKTDPTHKWFILHKQGIPENLFIDEATRQPYTGSDIKTFLMKLCNNRTDEFAIYLNNPDYQKAIGVKYGNINSKYRTLLRKAVPFKPINNITQFITEAVCEVNNPVNIIDMQNDIRKYKELEEDAVRIKERIDYLQNIADLTEQYALNWDKYLQQKYIVEKAKEVEKSEELATIQNEVEDLQNRFESLKTEREQLAVKSKELQDERDVLIVRYNQSPEKNKKDLLENTIGKIKTELETKECLIRKALHTLKALDDKWAPLVDKLRRNGVEVDPELSELLRDIRYFTTDDLVDFSFSHASELFTSFHNKALIESSKISTRLDTLSEEIGELEEKIENLENGIKPFPREVGELKNLIERTLSQRHGIDITVKVLADELEIDDESWRNAVENAMIREKFYLLVDEKYLDEAISIYESDENARFIYETGIIDVRKMDSSKIAKNPLSRILRSENSTAINYVEGLLSNIEMVDSKSELLNHVAAITKDSVLWKDRALTHLGQLDTDPYIGQSASKSLLEKLEKSKNEKNRERLLLSELQATYKKLLDSGTLESREARVYEEDCSHIPEIPELRCKLEEANAELANNSELLLFVADMQRKISTLETQKAEIAGRIQSIDNETGKVASDITGLSTNIIPALQSEIETIRDSIRDSFDAEWVIRIGEPRFQKVSQTKTEIQSLSTRFTSSMSVAYNIVEETLKKRRVARNDYNNKFTTSYDAEALDNKEYDEALEELERNKLPEYLDKIAEAKGEAYGRFRDDFINKIKSNIQECQKQIHSLNRALAQSVFATDCYKFEVKPNPSYKKFYDMFMDESLMDISEANLFSDDFNTKYSEEIQELFEKLIFIDDYQTTDQMQQFEKNVDFYTDYRSYLIFDLVVTDSESKREQHLSKTLNKKSGGETQIPFYIALLASFNQVCRVRNLNDNNTIRLIILDEAFSKMDGERIAVSINLLKEFGLQAIFSAPPEKINDISPLADKTLIVYRDGMKSIVKDYSILKETE